MSFIQKTRSLHKDIFEKKHGTKLGFMSFFIKACIQALKEIGNGKVTAVEEQKILDVLKKENEKDLKHDIALAPVWIQKIMRKALNNGKD